MAIDSDRAQHSIEVAAPTTHCFRHNRPRRRARALYSDRPRPRPGTKAAMAACREFPFVSHPWDCIKNGMKKKLLCLFCFVCLLLKNVFWRHYLFNFGARKFECNWNLNVSKTWEFLSRTEEHLIKFKVKL